MFRESLSRSVLKALSWRILGTLVTAGLVYATTRRLLLALGIGGAEWVLKLGCYFVHERVWNRIEVGREGADKKQARLRQLAPRPRRDGAVLGRGIIV